MSLWIAIVLSVAFMGGIVGPLLFILALQMFKSQEKIEHDDRP